MKRQRDILFLLISGFILTAIWISSAVYHNYASSTITDALQLEINPIDPRFDTKTLDQIKSRNDIEPVFEAQVASNSAPTPTPTSEILKTTRVTITPTISASPSAR